MKTKKILEITKKIVMMALLLLIVVMSFGCRVKNVIDTSAGMFVIKDGEETYIKDGQVLINRLVEVDGKLYYVDENGHKLKDEWAVIDNDGHYCYFGNFGDLVIDRIRTIDGKDYYFDKRGVLYQDRTEKKIITIEGVDYIANRNGELRLASIEENVEQEEDTKETIKEAIKETKKEETKTAVATSETKSNQAAYWKATQDASWAAAQQAVAAQYGGNVQVTQTTQNPANTAATTAAAVVSTEPPFANAIDISGGLTTPDEFGGPGIGLSTTTSRQVSPGSPGGGTTPGAPGGIVTEETTKTTNSTGEVKIKSTEKYTDSVEGDDYECEITLLMPIMNGKDDEETENLNACIEEIMDVWLEEITGIVSDQDTLPKSVTFTSATLGTVNKSRIIINLSGNMKPKSGSSKSLKYRITYDREEANAEIKKVN